jgi:hypothetical protein
MTMALQLREGTLNFPPTTGRRQRANTTVVFPTNVRAAQAAIKGYNVTYNNGDHHILEVEMDIDTTITANTVTVFGDFVFRDSSGFFDDPYSGFINFIVIADTF